MRAALRDAKIAHAKQVRPKGPAERTLVGRRGGIEVYRWRVRNRHHGQPERPTPAELEAERAK
jgi:hypothetical protein